jgi:hypothetical protein
MKTTLTLLLCLSLLGIFPVSVIALPQQGEASAIPLTNKDILDMFRSKLGDEVIIAKIKSSRCHFDTVPPMLGELKHNGVSDSVIRVMIEAPYGTPRQVPAHLDYAGREEPTTMATEAVLPDGKEITVVTIEDISSKTATEGDLLTFKVAEDVVIDGHIVIAKDTLVKGVVASSKKAGMMGKGGNLAIRVESTTTADNQKIKLRSSIGNEGDDKTGTTVALVVLFGPLGFLKHGKNAKVKAGTPIKTYTDEAKTIRFKG